MKTLGKINQQTINHIFPDKAGSKSDKVIQGPAFGVDTACIDLRNGKVLVTASDPLSILPNLGMKASAWLSVHLIANDVATSGQGPQFAQFVLNLPDTLGKTKYLEYWNYMHLFCKEIGVSITGGHTGFSDIGNSTLAGGGTMFSVVDKERDRKSTRLNSSHVATSYAVFCLKKKRTEARINHIHRPRAYVCGFLKKYRRSINVRT